jgi:hypothetical protein
LINRFSAAAQRYETTLKMLEGRRKMMAAKTPEWLAAGNAGSGSR